MTAPRSAAELGAELVIMLNTPNTMRKWGEEILSALEARELQVTELEFERDKGIDTDFEVRHLREELNRLREKARAVRDANYSGVDMRAMEALEAELPPEEAQP